MTIRFLLRLLLTALPFAGGCVSMHSLNYDEEIPPASNLTEACAYRWQKNVGVHGRGRALSGTTRWFEAPQYSSHLENTIRQEIEKRCDTAGPKPGGDATVTVYYLNYVNRLARGVVTMPLFFLSVATLGLLPVPGEDGFALCLDIALADGRHRYGLAEGQIRYVENIYGSGRSGGLRVVRHTNQEQMLANLLVRAFHKAWIPGQANLEQPNCRDALNSMLD
jgi:hypothetical protein